jgi:hypothetical protein
MCIRRNARELARHRAAKKISRITTGLDNREKLRDCNNANNSISRADDSAPMIELIANW